MNVDDTDREDDAGASRRHLSRRDFLTRSAALGLALPVAGSVLGSTRAGAQQLISQSRVPASSSQGIVVGLDTDIDTLDPIAFRSDAAYEAVIQVYEEPVDNKVVTVHGIAEGEAGTLVPGPASQFSISPHATVYKFTVRPGVRFSNGTPVNAETLQYSYLRALEGPGYASLLMSLLNVKHPSQLKVTGPMTFEIHLPAPNPLGPKIIPLSVLVLTDPTYSKQHATKSDPWAARWYPTHMMGTGPYLQSSTWQSGNEYLLSRNPSYWNPGKVRNAGVLLKYVPSEDDRALLLQQGSIDLAFGLPASKLNSLRSAGNLRLINVPSRNWNYLALNNTIKPFDDVRVRQAVAYAVPYDELIHSSLHGFASPLKGILAGGTPTLDTSLWPYSTNVAKAKHLLAEAGYANGVSSTLTVSASRANDVNSATFIQAALAKVGINVTINQASDADFRTKEDAGELPMFIDYWYSWVDDPFYQMFWLLNSANASSTNVAKYKDKAMDALITQGFYEANSAKRTLISREVQARFAAQVPYVPLYSENFTLATHSGVSGVNVWPDQYVRFWMLSKS